VSAYSLGTAEGEIRVNYKGDGVKQAKQDIEGIKKTGEEASKGVDKLGTASGVAGLAIAAGFGVAVKSAADFEKGMSGIQAVSGATSQEMESVRKKALQLGADTSFSASEASVAIEELVKAGISIPDVMNGAADATVALAEAGGVDLPQAATIAANAMNQFGLTSAELPGIVDKIAGAANASAIDVTDLGQSMAQVGAVAKLAGLSFDDTALAITAMGNAGIKGSDAGTSLKTFLMNLQPATKAQADLMRELGIVTEDGGNRFFDASGKIKSMSEIAGVLGTSLQGMSDQQRTAALETMFGSDAIRAAAVIADQGAAGMDNLATQIGKVSAADVAATRMNNLSGKVEQFKGSMDTLAITVGSMLLPALTSMAQKLTEAVNWFNALSPGTQSAIVGFIGVVGGILLLVAAGIKLVKFAKDAKMAITAMRTAMMALNASFLANPIFLIIMAIIALVAGLVLLYKKNETFRNFVNAAWASIKAAIGAVVDWITGTAVPWIVNAWSTIVAGAKALWSGIQSAWNSIVSAVTTAVNAVKSVVMAIWGAIVTAVTFYLNAIRAVVMFVWNAIVFAVTTYINMVRTVISTVLSVIMAIWNGFWNMFGGLITAVWELIKTVIQVALAWIQVIISTALNFIIGLWTTVWNVLVAVVTTVWNAISTAISAALSFIQGIISTVWNAISSTVMGVVTSIGNAVSSAWDSIKNITTVVFNGIRAIASSVWNTIQSAISGAINSAKAAVSSAVSAIQSAVSSSFNAAKSAATSAFNALRDAVSSAIQSALDKIRSVVSSIQGVFAGAGGWLVNAGRQIIQGLINGIQSMIGSVTSAISGITSKIRGFLPGSPIKEGPLKDHGWNSGEPGKKLVTFLAGGIADNVGMLEKSFAGIDLGIPSSLTVPEVAINASAQRTFAVQAARGAESRVSDPNRDIKVEFNAYNPVAERSSETAVREMTRLAALGVF